MNTLDYLNILNIILPLVLIPLFVALCRITGRIGYLSMVPPLIYWLAFYVLFFYRVHFSEVPVDAIEFQIGFRILLWLLGVSMLVFALSEIVAYRLVKKVIKEAKNGGSTK